MTLSPLDPTKPTLRSQPPNAPAWYRPTISPEHGVYVMLLVSFVTGAAAAQAWTWMTTLALLCAVCGFQAEHPLIVQIRQRRSPKPRLLVWGGIYGGVAIGLMIYLYWQQSEQQGALGSPLLGIALAALAALLIDGIAVFRRAQKSIVNELVTFFAVCLSAPLAYTATTGTLTGSVWGLWLLNSLFFAGPIFTVKFRKDQQHAILPSLVYHAIATLLVAALVWIGALAPLTALAFGVVLLKFGFILWQKDWYCTTAIRWIAVLETGAALLFLLIVALSLLPVYLPG